MLKVFHSSRALWTLAFATGDVWTVITWVWGSGVDILDHLGPAEYGAALFAFTALIGLVNYSWINARRPAVRLKDHVALIEELRTVSEQALSDPTRAQHAFNLILEAKQILEEQFSIACPGMVEPDPSDEMQIVSNWLNDWGAFAAVLLPRMRRGDLTMARKSLSGLEVKLRPMASWV